MPAREHGHIQSRSWQAGESKAISGGWDGRAGTAWDGAKEGQAPGHQGRDSHPRKGIIAASRSVLEASFLHRDHRSAAQPGRVGMAHAWLRVARRSRAVVRLGGVRGGAQTLSDTLPNVH
jgi:hypothetical protein